MDVILLAGIPVTMATKSKKTSITNTFGPGATSMQYEPVWIGYKPVEFYGLYKDMVAQFSVRPSFFHYTHISVIFQ